METLDVEAVISHIAENRELVANDDVLHWIVRAAKERVFVSPKSGLFSRMRYGLFRTLARNDEPSYDYFGLDGDFRLTIEVVPVEL